MIFCRITTQSYLVSPGTMECLALIETALGMPRALSTFHENTVCLAICEAFHIILLTGTRRALLDSAIRFRTTIDSSGQFWKASIERQLQRPRYLSANLNPSSKCRFRRLPSIMIQGCSPGSVSRPYGKLLANRFRLVLRWCLRI